MPYAVTPYPALSWSESKARRWRECRRAHFWAVYHQHNGWLPGAPASRRLAWILGKLVRGWPAALGITVHRRAAECVAACRAGRPLPTFDALRRAAAADLNGVFTASRDKGGDFLADPSRWPVLEAAFYGDQWQGDELRATAERLDAALDRLLACHLWEALRAAASNDILLIDPFHSFVLRGTGILVYAAPDLVFRQHAGAPTELWDVKCGRDDAVDQLLTYALAARESLDRPLVHGYYIGGVIHLGQGAGEDTPFQIDEGDVDAAAVRIQTSAAAMQQGLADVVRNVPGSLDQYPRTANLARCPRCPYRGLCDPDTFPFAGGVGGSRPTLTASAQEGLRSLVHASERALREQDAGESVDGSLS